MTSEKLWLRKLWKIMEMEIMEMEMEMENEK
jgi:hypothetical protein